MAHLETVHTGMRVITHVKGRVYRHEQGRASAARPHQSLKDRARISAAKRRRVCLLNAREAEWLEDYAISQPCFGPHCHHQHFTRSMIEPLVKAGDLRWVGDSMNVAAWHDPRQLVTRRSMGMSTVQLRAVGA
jgi:hypothetical protein